MSFSPDWLALREPFDHAARSVELATAFAAALPERARLLELGAGTGSGVRFLMPYVPGARWWLLDHDAKLLAQAESLLSAPRVTPWLSDVRDFDAWPSELDGVQLQALLDLVDLSFLASVVDVLATRRLPVLAALTVDGRVSFQPAHPDDDAIHGAFRLHQRGVRNAADVNRERGGLVGPHAGAIFADLLRVRGFSTVVRTADWRVPSTATAMLSAMIEGTAEAAAQVGPREVDVARWSDDRRRDLAAGRLTLAVGHQDVLGLPAPR